MKIKFYKVKISFNSLFFFLIVIIASMAIASNYDAEKIKLVKEFINVTKMDVWRENFITKMGAIAKIRLNDKIEEKIIDSLVIVFISNYEEDIDNITILTIQNSFSTKELMEILSFLKTESGKKFINIGDCFTSSKEYNKLKDELTEKFLQDVLTKAYHLEKE